MKKNRCTSLAKSRWFWFCGRIGRHSGDLTITQKISEFLPVRYRSDQVLQMGYSRLFANAQQLMRIEFR